MRIRSQFHKLSLVLLAALPLASANAQNAQTTAPTPTAVTVAKGDARLNALLQFWGLNDSTNANLNYRIRRSEIKFSGNAAPGSRYFVSIDPSKSLQAAADNKVLQDLGVGFALTPELEIVVGQFKIPTTAEGVDSAAELLFPERSMVARAYGDKRETGVMLTYKLGAFKANLMSSNGQATNVDDNNNSKDIHARVDFNLSDIWKVGAFTTAGDASYQARARWGVNTRAELAGTILSLEGVRADDTNAGTTGYSVDVAHKFADTFIPGVRYEGMQTSTTTSTALTFGLNYLVAKNNSKIQAAYSVLSNVNGNNGSYQAKAGTDGSLFILGFQSSI